MSLVTNPCGHPYCWEPMCSDIDWICPYFKPLLFGFIPVSKKFGDWLFFKQEQRFFKKYYKEHPISECIDDDFAWDDCEAVIDEFEV